MLLESTKPRVGTTALTRTHFLLLYAAMLVAASGNTALQSVMPAIGREIGISDFWVAVAYTWSAVLWVAACALLGGEERPSRPQGADAAGPERLHRLHVSLRHGPALRPEGSDRRRSDLHPVRDLPSDLRLARQCHAIGNAGLSCGEDTAQRPGGGSFRTLLLVRTGHDHRAGCRAFVRAALCRACRDPCSPSR